MGFEAKKARFARAFCLIKNRPLASMFALVLGLSFASPPSWAAQTIRVPADQSSIQGAITAAMDGDTILVAPGTYLENLDFLGKGIVVQSERGPALTIIDGQRQGPVVSFVFEEPVGAKIAGFTLKNGGSSIHAGQAGGILIYNSSPTVSGNIVRDNVDCSTGGVAIRTTQRGYGTTPRIENNQIINNSVVCYSPSTTGGISIFGNPTALIKNNVISHNQSNGGAAINVNLTLVSFPWPLNFVTIKNNVISHNINKASSTSLRGGGVSILNRANVRVIQNLIFGNRVETAHGEALGAGIYWGAARPSPSYRFEGPYVINNTIVDNILVASAKSQSFGSGIFAGGYDELSVVENNIVVGQDGVSAFDCGIFNDAPPIHKNNNVFTVNAAVYSGFCLTGTGMDGNVSVDPGFLDPAKEDFRLSRFSPLIDGGDNLAPELPSEDLDGRPRLSDGDADGTAKVDIGAFEFVNAEDEVVADFGAGLGLWSRGGDGTWRHLHNLSPETHVTAASGAGARDRVIGDFGPLLGIWSKTDTTAWQLVNRASAETILAGRLDAGDVDDLVIDFGPAQGLWAQFDGSTWSRLSTLSPGAMALTDMDGDGQEELIADFGATRGLWIWRNSAWQRLHRSSAVALTGGNLDGDSKGDVVVDFGAPLGLWAHLNDTEWVKLHRGSPSAMMAAPDRETGGLVAAFPGLGLWRWQDGTWTRLHRTAPESLTAADLDRDSTREIVADFGSMGLWARDRNSGWIMLHRTSPEAIAAADLDGK